MQKPSNLSNTISPEATPSESFITHLPLSTVLLAQYCLLDWSLRFSRVSPVSQPASQSGLPPVQQPPARLNWQPQSHHFNRAAKSLLNASDTHSEYGISLFFYYRQISHSLCLHKSSHSVSVQVVLALSLSLHFRTTFIWFVYSRLKAVRFIMAIEPQSTKYGFTVLQVCHRLRCQYGLLFPITWEHVRKGSFNGHCEQEEGTHLAQYHYYARWKQNY